MAVNAVSAMSYGTQKTDYKKEVEKNDDNNLLFDLNGNTDEDDGKVDFKTGITSFFSGMKDKIVNQVSNLISNAKKDPLGTAIGAGFGIAATVGLTIAAASFPAVAIGAGVLGGIFGLFKTGKAVANGIKEFQNYNNATSDKEALDALYNMGGSTTETIEGVAMTLASARAAHNGLRGIASKHVMELEQSSSPFANKLKGLLSDNQIKTAQALLNNSENTVSQYANAFYDYNNLSYTADSVANMAAADTAIVAGMATLDEIALVQKMFDY